MPSVVIEVLPKIRNVDGHWNTGYHRANTTPSCESSASSDTNLYRLEFLLTRELTSFISINCVDKSCGQMNIAGGGGDTGTAILSWPMENGENTLFYLDSKN